MDTPDWFHRDARTRAVTASDGRVWALRRAIVWRFPHADDVEYEHDVRSGGTPAIIGALVMFWAVVIYLFSRPLTHVPWYFWMVAVLGLAFIPIGWILGRPWVISAECAHPLERWIGHVVGRGNARAEMRITARALQTHGSPAHKDCPLQLVQPPPTTTNIISWPQKEDPT